LLVRARTHVAVVNELKEVLIDLEMVDEEIAKSNGLVITSTL